jgi:predicted sulfurtransferase
MSKEKEEKEKDLGFSSQMTNDVEKKLDELSTKETANLVKSFQVKNYKIKKRIILMNVQKHAKNLIFW